MCLTCIQTRDNKPMSQGPIAEVDAFLKLLLWELGFGGSVSDMSDESVTVTTKLGGYVDTTEIRGEPTEMGHVLKLCAAHALVEEIQAETHSEAVMGLLPDYLSPSLASEMAPLVLGEGLTRGAISFLLMSTGDTQFTMEELSKFPLSGLGELYLDVIKDKEAEPNERNRR